MASRNITILVRVEGAAKASRELADTTAQLHRMGQESRRTSDLVRNMSTNVSRMGNVVSHAARYGAFAMAAMAAATVKAGISFNATMEATKVSFATILGSKKAADDYTKSLIRIATETPFQLTDVIQGTRSLLAFGMQAKEARTTIDLLGNAIATGMGGPQEIERSTRALGQIQAAGVLHAQDLNQLIQANVLSLPKLSSRLGKTTKEFRKEMSLGKITAKDFFGALRDMWANDPLYKGAAEKAMRTFNGQVERMKDMFARASGAITEGLFEVLKKRVIPATSDLLSDLEAIFSYKEWTAGEKMNAALTTFQVRWKPIKEDFVNWWKRNDMGTKVRESFEKGLAVLLPAFANAAEDAARAFWNAWWDSGTKTKAITALALLTFLGITKTVLTGAAGMLWSALKLPFKAGKGKGGVGGALGGSAVGNMTVYATHVTVMGGVGKPGATPVPAGKPRIKPKPRPKPPIPAPLGNAAKLGKWGPIAARVATAMGMSTSAFVAVGGLAYLATHYNEDLSTKGVGGSNPSNPSGHVGFTPGGLQRDTSSGGASDYANYSEGGAMAPIHGVGRDQVTVINVQVDGKTIAVATHRAANQKKSAR